MYNQELYEPNIVSRPIYRNQQQQRLRYQEQAQYINQQQQLLMPTTQQFNRNNYHYNYSPPSSQKIIASKTQQNFYKPTKPNQPYSQKLLSPTLVTNNKDQLQKQIIYKQRSELQLATLIGEKFSQEQFQSLSKVMNLYKFVSENVKLRSNLLNELSKIRQARSPYTSNSQSRTIISNNQSRAIITKQQSKTITRDTTPKRHSREKSSNLYNNRKIALDPQTKQQTAQDDQQIQMLFELKQRKQQQIQQSRKHLAQLKASTQRTRQHLHTLQCQALHQSIHQTPLLRQKHQSIEYLSVQIQWLNQKNKHLKRLNSLQNQKKVEDKIFELYEQMCRECETVRKENNKKSEQLKQLFEKTNKLTGKQENVNMFLMNLRV